MGRTEMARAAGGLAVCAFAALVGMAGTGAQSVEAPAPDPLARMGFAVTAGAAPGYVPDRTCSICHNEIYRSYQQVGMAKSFYRPAPDKDIEDFADNRFFHEPSGRHYEMVRDGERLVFRRWQLDPDGEPIHLLEQDVDWVLGSGHHSRVYLYRTPGGELYQLPLAWYTQEGAWRMAPGYDRPDHQGLTRRVQRECMFCHNAYPDVPEGSDAYGEIHIYPAELPEGLGCQRCHGPGAEHLRAAFTARGSREPEEVRETLRATIVNPGRLPAQLRDDICFGCHLQPAVALPGVRRFGRGDYSFRPGEPLTDYLIPVDVDEAGRERGERFEINHHPYRLMQSRCWRESGGELSCLTCHDPHRKVPEAERAAHYRAACQTCHEIDDCGRQEMTGHGEGSPAAADGGDCTACHMPKRRTQDVVHVVMTDHLIRRRPGGPELLAPLAESEPVLVDVEPLWPERSPTGALGEVYRAVSVLRVGGRSDGVLNHLARMLAQAEPRQPDPYLDLGRGLLKRRRFGSAERTLDFVRGRFPESALALEWLGMVRLGQGRRSEALTLLRLALELDPERPEASFNLARVLVAGDEEDEALALLRRSVELRPNLVRAWYHLGLLHQREERLPEAAASLRRALAIEPSDTDSYLTLARVLVAAGERDEALRILRHGAGAAARPAEVAALLDEVEDQVEEVEPATPSHVE